MQLKAGLGVLLCSAVLSPVALGQLSIPSPNTAPTTVPTRRVVTFHATTENVKAVFGPADPVAALRPGDTLDTNTLDCFGGALKKPGDTMNMVKMDNPLTGPFYIEGAQPGDTLVLKFLDLSIDGDQGIGNFVPGFGALSGSTYTPMLNHDLPERIWFYPIDKATNTAPSRPPIPISPLRFRCIRSWVASESRPPTVKRAVRLSRRNSAATWTHPRPASAIRFIFL